MSAHSALSLSPLPAVDDAVWQPLDWYACPLYYDIVFEEETVREAQWLHQLFILFAPTPSPSEASERPPVVLEPACGSGRLLHALLIRGYRCIGFDRQPAAIQFAGARCKAALEHQGNLEGLDRPAAAPSSSAYCMFEADLTNFMSAQPLLLPPASVHMAHCLVSSLKYVLSPQSLMAHFQAVADSLVDGGVYVVALHVCEYGDQQTPSVDEHEAERAGVRVWMRITCSPADAASRTEHVHIRMAVKGRSGSTHYYRWEETMRSYDRAEVWQLLSELEERCFDVLATFDYEQARRGQVEEPLEWPSCMPEPGTAGAMAATQLDWTGWDGVEAVAVVLRRKHR